MRYIVTIKKDSGIGAALMQIGHDGLNGGNPKLDCSAVDMSHPYFFHATRGPIETAEGPKHVSVHFPNDAVLFVFEYAKGEPHIGF